MINTPAGTWKARRSTDWSTDDLRRALEVLTEEQRDVLSLRVIGNLTLEETAVVVGKRVGAVKALQRRALIALREHLEQKRVSL